MRIEKLKERLTGLKDPRRTRYGNLRHKLIDIIIIGLLSTICDGEDFKDMEEFGKEREEWLKIEFGLELKWGIPDEDTFRRVFERLKPAELGACLHNWIAEEREPGKVKNIDGKTIRGSKSHEHKAYHVVSVWCAENQITLGEVKTAEKSNEITAVPEVLDIVDVSGSIVTADAMSCQTDIVIKLTEKEADYIIGLKKNQPNLYEAVEEYFLYNPKSALCAKEYAVEKGHGRIEKREYYLETELDWLEQKDEWANLNAVGMVKSVVERKGKTSFEIRYFIASVTDMKDFAYAVRKHWSIENQLHWCLDVIFGEDASRAKKDNSPLNLNVLSKTALSLLKNADMGDISIRRKRRKATMNPNVLKTVIFGED